MTPDFRTREAHCGMDNDVYDSHAACAVFMPFSSRTKKWYDYLMGGDQLAAVMKLALGCVLQSNRMKYVQFPDRLSHFLPLDVRDWTSILLLAP